MLICSDISNISAKHEIVNCAQFGGGEMRGVCYLLCNGVEMDQPHSGEAPQLSFSLEMGFFLLGEGGWVLNTICFIHNGIIRPKKR